jgi:hypothetical protein
MDMTEVLHLISRQYSSVCLREVTKATKLAVEAGLLRYKILHCNLHDVAMTVVAAVVVGGGGGG